MLRLTPKATGADNRRNNIPLSISQITRISRSIHRTNLYRNLFYLHLLTAHDRATDLPLDLRVQPRGLYLVQLVGPTGLVSRKLLLE